MLYASGSTQVGMSGLSRAEMAGLGIENEYLLRETPLSLPTRSVRDEIRLPRYDNFQITSLQVIHEFILTRAQITTLATLQGLVNRNRDDMLFIETVSDLDWSLLISRTHNIPRFVIDDFNAILARYKQEIDGYALYDFGNNFNSRNAAVSVCGIMNVIAVDVTLRDLVESHGIRMKIDMSGLDELHVLNTHWHALNHDMVLEYSEQEIGLMYDLATYQQAMVYHDGTGLPPLPEQVIPRMNRHGYLFGWRGGRIGFGDSEEFFFFSTASNNSVIPLVSPNMANLSVLSQFEEPPLIQKSGKPAGESYPLEEDAHYVAFIMSDGDNIEWFYNTFHEPTWWSHPVRSLFPINWEINPSLLTFAPSIMRYYYDSATENDFFVTGSSGFGTIYPPFYPDIGPYLIKLNQLMEQTDLQVATCLVPHQLPLSILDSFTTVPAMEGVVFKSTEGFYHDVRGVHFQNGIPIKGIDAALWFGDFSAPDIAKFLNNRPRDPRNNINSYTFVTVHAWSPNIMFELEYAVQLLDPKVKVVSCTEIFSHLRENFS